MGGRIFGTSDNHFGHGNIIRLAGRPFKDLDEMHAVMVNNWNEVVSQEDEVIVDGDFSFMKPEQTRDLMRRLNGTKYLVRGNHDKTSCKSPAVEEWAWVKDYFVLNYQDNRGPNRDGKHWQLVFSHFPFLTWEAMYRGSINVAGHRHLKHSPDNAQKCPECSHSFKRVRRFDVGVDANDFRPVAITKIIDACRDIPPPGNEY